MTSRASYLTTPIIIDQTCPRLKEKLMHTPQAPVSLTTSPSPSAPASTPAPLSLPTPSELPALANTSGNLNASSSPTPSGNLLLAVLINAAILCATPTPIPPNLSLKSSQILTNVPATLKKNFNFLSSPSPGSTASNNRSARNSSCGGDKSRKYPTGIGCAA
ncbi:hypothetical protein K458DRAFT_403582 [Lentithecium fluviatile CBS 122367]|uniref:Uncharacterized protein n=1 Tax=Lentithecium fluviatile CBS 122367 TaxID=1168545 RepID=A0A6G1J4E3_9PLEO|nr:hypothetical protein K458DRAFT_403582 [Lentithecium fluviatile CBS 122367]